jgi:hypothetical protein
LGKVHQSKRENSQWLKESKVVRFHSYQTIVRRFPSGYAELLNCTFDTRSKICRRVAGKKCERHPDQSMAEFVMLTIGAGHGSRRLHNRLPFGLVDFPASAAQCYAETPHANR